MRGIYNKVFEIKWTKKELEEQFNIKIWSDKKIKEFNQILLAWYDSQAETHNFPWRLTNDPYKIWISEIMLQQTRTDTVIPYFERFIEAFPNIKHLAEAPEEFVLKLWEGLGYYSRAKNLKEAAMQIMLNHEGVFPSDTKDIVQLKGIGPYTAGAIGSMAFNLPIPAIDGNLMRVLSRLFEIDLDISVVKNRKVFETVGLFLIDQNRPGDWNQAMMDLGRTICTPKNYIPERSPVKEFNASFINDTWTKYPVKKAKSKPKPVTYISLIIQNEDGKYLLEKRPDKGLLANMWQFPLIEVEQIISDGTWKSFKPVILDALDEENYQFVKEYLKENYQLLSSIETQTNGIVEHVFSHLKWSVSIFNGKVTQNISKLPERCAWVSADEFELYTFPTVQKKIWDAFTEIKLF